MPNYVVLRLIPPAATHQATFNSYLQNLTINVYDASYAHPEVSAPPPPAALIGSAVFVPPAFPPPVGTQIVQHLTPPLMVPPPEAVATAIIQYNGPPSGTEYVGPDLRIEYVRAGAAPILDPETYYDVHLHFSALPPAPNQFQLIPDSEVSAFVTIPPVSNAGAATLTIPTDGTPPNFDSLLTAVWTVLAQDPALVPPPPGVPPPLLLDEISKLSLDQCRNIAYEIVYAPQAALPAPPDALEHMYTNPPNTGTYNDSNEQNRLGFQGKLAGYYGTSDATALRLTNFVFSLSAAVYCHLQTVKATSALVEFPVNPNAVPPPTLTTVAEAQVIFTGAVNAAVPAEYFYALAYEMSPQVTKDHRYQMATIADQQQNLNRLTDAVDAGWISVAAVNPAQVVRRLEALYIPASSTVTQWPLAVSISAQNIFTDWLAFPIAANWRLYQAGDDLSQFWSPEAIALPPGDFLNLVLFALTQGYVIPIAGTLLADEIIAHLLALPLNDVTQLANATPADWENFFNTLPGILGGGVTPEDVLPPLTLPGTVAARIDAFIRYLQKFFQMKSGPVVIPPTGARSPDRYGVPAFDLIEQTIAAYAGFAFGPGVVLATLQTAAATLPIDPQAQAWVVQAIWTINELFLLANLPQPASFQFSVMEALFARGFTSREEVLDVPFADFQQALTGTVAYDSAAAIYANAGPPNVFPPPPPPGFDPINPCCLTDCIPPLYLSPLGPIAYLHEMLQVSERSTCDDPFAPPAAGSTTLQAHIEDRRGPVGDLKVTRANLETPLPLVDLVNECLEYMACTTPPTQHGTVYDTSEDALAGHDLCTDECRGEKEHEDEDHCHKPAVLFDALPEYSTPATPVAANNAVEPTVWDKLRADFSTCCLPYDQPLDVSRTYLEHFGTCRYEEMRTFRRCITEFVLDPVNQPVEFQTHLWRYPVRIDIAIEYLGISPEEFITLFQGLWPRSCSQREDDPRHAAQNELQPWQLYGFAAEHSGDTVWTATVVRLPEFLKRTCLTYCEFIELWKCGPVIFRNGADRRGEFPECEPCCLEKLWLEFPEGRDIAGLWETQIFIRLWRKLKHLCGAGYTMCQLADICNVLGFPGPDFIRQLAAFQMLRDQFRLKLTGDDIPPGATGADRTYLLSLWVDPAPSQWHWAAEHLIRGIAYHAARCHKREDRGPECLKVLASNFDDLSLLAGFDPSSAADTWHAVPTHTLRFAEILAKIYASKFTIGEILFLFTTAPHLEGDDPLPLQDEDEAEDLPLELPEDQDRHSLWELRRKLLYIHVPGEEVHRWTWRRVESALTNDFGFAVADVHAFGEHFFPHVLESHGHPVSPQARRFLGNLAATAPQIWNTPPEGPFHYDDVAHKLWAVLPLSDEEVLEQLTRVQALNQAEQQAVQDVYYQPRFMLSAFAVLFSNFEQAEHRLIEEQDSEKRWHYFQRQFSLFYARCRILAQHLSEHVEAVTSQERPEGEETALLVLKHLYADENFATAPWENDLGQTPPVTWTPRPNGGAIAAVLGLVGTGLHGVFEAGGKLAWQEVRGPMRAFGHERDRQNCPVPTVIPSMGLALTPQQMKSVTLRNGLAMDDARGHWLGGAEGFRATWRGALLIEEEGEYHFCAGAPAANDEEPSREAAHHRSWKVILRRGQKTWIILRHHWHHEEDLRSDSLHLRRGAYELTVELVQHSPEYLYEPGEVHPQHTGFEIKYSGPDSHNKLVTIPHDRLFRILKDDTLAVAGLAGSPAQFLSGLYTSSLRDIRRTYQRAFKALLFSHRFRLSARRRAGEGSELGYMLDRKEKFSGSSCYSNAGVWTIHRADFDFNFLPVTDEYFPPANDQRAHPSAKRVQAMFDWWERIFDYDCVRREVREECERHLWLLFAEAFEKNPADPRSLLRHMCADARHWPQDLHFFQDQVSPVYAVTSDDLEDDRWTMRAWHADRWLRRLWRRFTVADMTKARPDLWASDDPSSLAPGVGETGNANLLEFLCDGCFEIGAPRRYEDVERVNDGLRERGREALISYLCGPSGIAHTSKDLSEILLLDVRAAKCERASRIEEAISAAQVFIRRSRLGLEPVWSVTPAFAQMWDFRFASYHVWQACKRRELYKENWIEWHELEKAKKVEAFQFLDEELRRVTMTIGKPGGVDYWPQNGPPTHPGLCLLQHSDVTEMQILPAPREGLNLLATPERDARPSWITMVPDLQAAPPPQPGVVPIGAPLPAAAPEKLPFWIECAIRLGTRFIRVAAAAYPPASREFEPRHDCDDVLGQAEKDEKKDECCVSCCKECGCEHPPRVDEYWFWLIDSEYLNPKSQPVFSGIYDGQQKEYYDQNAQEATPWHDTTQLPALLAWPLEPMVRLAWCRVHNGMFQQPRRSVWGVAVNAIASPDITFLGRLGDSLYFDVTNSVNGTGGFRYDMVPDLALDFDNLVVPAVPPPPPPPGGLIAYPYFAYFNPGARLFPWAVYSPAVAMAHALRAHCRFEAALKWYDVAYNPLDHDNRWAKCEPEAPPPPPPPPSFLNAPEIGANPEQLPDIEVPPRQEGDRSCCCDASKISCHEARHRSILLYYLETLLEWSDALMRGNSPEAFQQVSLLLDTMRKIVGPHPTVVKNPIKVNQTVVTFDPLFAPINPRLMMLYDRLDDRVALLHDCLSARRLREASERHDAQFWGDDPVHDGLRSTMSPCCDAGDWCHPPSPYRFVFLNQKAKELAVQVRELGALLLAAFEKGDAEYLASIRARHERELAELNRRVREDQWRDADWQVQALGKTKASDQASRRYYAQLIANGLIANEQAYVDQIGVSIASRTAANVMEAIAEAMDVIPDIFVGTVDYVQLPLGTKLAGLFKTLARVSNTIADIAGSTASLDLTEAGWDRRLQDWVHQVEILDIQIEQVELQILGAERRRHEALRELNIQHRQIEHATESLDFLRDRFTNHAAYLFLQKYVADLYYGFYELALDTARQAERACNFELGHIARKFISCEHWDNLHEGLLAGERLQLDLSRMEKEYCDLNRREYELTKHISLLTHFPREFLRLKVTGRCEIDIPEWIFDLDYPGQYMRRIKNITLTIPCVSGPYNEVHCRLTLLRSTTRVDPLLRPPAALCCDCNRKHNGYHACPHDPRVVREYGATEAIATSGGQNDAGLFEVNFHDERYLPFEFHGAVSRWRIELPYEDNYFSMETLSDLILHLNYTSREGGPELRLAAREAAERELPGEGWRLFDLRHDFADAWELFHRSDCDEHLRDEREHRKEYDHHHKDKQCREQEERHDEERRREENRLALRFSRNMFPFVPGHRELCIEKMALLFNRCEHCRCECPSECPCCMDPTPAAHEIELQSGHGHEEEHFRCVLSDHWPGLYHGVVETRIGPLHSHGERTEVQFRFPKEVCCITRAYLLCRYKLEDRCPKRKEVAPLRCNSCDSN